MSDYFTFDAMGPDLVAKLESTADEVMRLRLELAKVNKLTCLEHGHPMCRDCAMLRGKWGTEIRTSAIEEVISFIEGGRFLHDDAPPKRFATEVVAGIRRALVKGAP